MAIETETPGKFAIIGIGCRMPPNAMSLAGFWKFLLKGGNALKAIKKDRWDWRQFFDGDQKRPGKTYAPKAASLDADVRQFDPLAFGISPREANCLDPQQRLLLEVTWEAFEDAGIPRARMSGSTTGVFIGGFCLDHLLLQSQPSNRHLVNANSPAGATMTVLSNRISHTFNLKGPSVTLDTACSSSLVAIHYACQSLRSGECDMALAGGVNVMTRPDFPILMSKGHFLSDHGECRAFDESASGYARGEGSGIFLIKPYEKACADGDVIHAVISGTGVNQDGHTDGISLPNSAAQERLIGEVYRRSGVAPADVDYVEAHGTGTQAGDPAEAQALDRNFSVGRNGTKLFVGSVKTNVGHLEAAAGVAGMLKAIGVLQHREIPKNLHFRRPNPKIPFADYCLQIVKETTKLPSKEEKPTLYAGVNSFGYGGTNAHILLESAPIAAARESTAEQTALRMISFSARNEKALRDLAGKFAFQIGQGLPGTFADLAYTAAFRRSHREYRAVAVASDLEQLREQLIATSTGQPHDGMTVSVQAAESPTGLVFVYTGMGPQWWAMGQELMRAERVFSEAIDEIDGYFQPLSGWSLREAMLANEAASLMARTEVAQPANFALQVALTRLMKTYGISPVAVVGHSVGEVVAAYVAGVYTLEEAVRISYHRSRLQQSMAGRGSMLAVGLPRSEAEKLIAAFPDVSIAAVNSFHAVTLSGDDGQLKQIAADLEKREIFQKALRVEVAYHSSQMDPLREDLLQALTGLAPQAAQIPLYSTAYGRMVPAEEWNAEYWWQNVRQPVHFAEAMKALFADGFTSFFEIGPHPVLGNSIKECAAHLDRKVRCFASLRRNEPEGQRVLLSLGDLYCEGYDLEWEALAPSDGKFIPGPLYPWQRERYWLESERSEMERLGLPGSVYLNRSQLGRNYCWEVEINRNYFPFLFDHGVQDQTVFAGMAYIEAAIVATQRIHEVQAITLENVRFEKVLIVDYSKLQYLITECSPEEGKFALSSRVEGEEDSLVRQCRGRMIPQTTARPEQLHLSALRKECAEQVAPEDFFANLQQRGLLYGSAFRSTTEVSVGDRCFLVKIDGSRVADEETHPLHPTLFDAAIQPIIFRAEAGRLFVPSSVEQFQYFSRPGTECYAFGRLREESDTTLVADVWLTDAAGLVHACARHISLQVIEMQSRPVDADLFYEPTWRASEALERKESDGSDVLILTDAARSALAAQLAAGLPGSAILTSEAAETTGFHKEEMRAHLQSASLATRRRIIVLWEPADSDSLATAICSLDEKLIGLFQALAERGDEAIDLTLVTHGAKSVRGNGDLTNLAGSSLSALGLVGQNEFQFLSCRSIDFLTDEPEAPALIGAEMAAGSRGDIAYRDNQRFEHVLLFNQEEEEAPAVVKKSTETALELHLGVKGKTASLHLESTERRAPGEGEIELRVHAVALNYKDILKAQGQIDPLVLENTFWGTDLGMECAGIVLRTGPQSRFAPGDRVVTILPRAFRTYATVPETFVVKIPDQLGMECAAIPVVYLAAYRGLIEMANLQPGERVLIHHATGGLGLAAVEIAHWKGAEIFATAGSEEKRLFLNGLGIKNIYSSRDLDFAQLIRETTDHEGVDVVISAQTGLAMHASLNLLRTGGRYIEVGKKDIAEDLGLPLRAFNRNLTFASLDIDRLAKERPLLIQQTLRRIFDHFEKGDFKPRPATWFEASALSEAFAEMSRSRQIGKLLVDFSRGEVEVPEKTNHGPLIKRDGSYIVTGGTSGFGLATARWLAEQGAGRILLVSRSGPKAPGIEATVAQLEALGSQVEVLSVDVTSADQVRALVEHASAALRGIVHGAMVLDDGMMANLTEDRFRRVFLTKVAGALNLADALATPNTLDFFVFDSSISAVIGNRGQANYVAANSVLDHLAHSLRNRNIPAVSINWGALAESGVVARDERLLAILSSVGVTPLTDQQAFLALEYAIRSKKPQLGAFLVDWSKWQEAHPKLADDPRFRDQRIRAQDGGGSSIASEIRNSLAGASREQRLRSLEDHLIEVLGGILKMSKEDIPVTRKLSELGVDSLMVLELSLGIEARIGVNFSAMEFLKGPNLQQLAVLAENKLWNI